MNAEKIMTVAEYNALKPDDRWDAMYEAAEQYTNPRKNATY